MLYNIHTGVGVRQQSQRDIVYLVSTVERVRQAKCDFVFTDRHAYVANAAYFSDPADLARLDWSLIRGRDFRRDPNRPDKMDRRAAEFLVRHRLPVEGLVGIGSFDEPVADTLRSQVAERSMKIPVKAKREWYF